MTPQEIIDLLSIAAGYDQRTVGQGDVEAWRLALEDPRVPNLAYDEAVDAVIVHYRDSTDFLKPAHILAYVKGQRRTNLARLMPAKGADTTAAYAGVGDLWRKAHTEATERRRARRAAVLAHPDLAERLTQPPLSYGKAEQWNGGIPPETFGSSHNDSPRRAALLELADEAERRAGATR